MITTILTLLCSSIILPGVLTLVSLNSRYKEHASIINKHYRNVFLLKVSPLNTAINPLDNSGRIELCLKLTSWVSLFAGNNIALRLQHIKECLETDKLIRLKIEDIGLQNLPERCSDDKVQQLFNSHLDNTLRFFFNIKLLTASSFESRKLLKAYEVDSSIYSERYDGYYKEYL